MIYFKAFKTHTDLKGDLKKGLAEIGKKIVSKIYNLKIHLPTLVSLINEHAHCKKISDFSSLLALIRACLINYF